MGLFGIVCLSYSMYPEHPHYQGRRNALKEKAERQSEALAIPTFRSEQPLSIVAGVEQQIGVFLALFVDYFKIKRIA